MPFSWALLLPVMLLPLVAARGGVMSAAEAALAIGALARPFRRATAPPLPLPWAGVLAREAFPTANFICYGEAALQISALHPPRRQTLRPNECAASAPIAADCVWQSSPSASHPLRATPEFPVFSMTPPDHNVIKRTPEDSEDEGYFFPRARLF